MTNFEKALKQKFLHIPQDAAPGFRLIAARKGQLIANVGWGKTWQYYDLASLTKIIFTASQFMVLESQGQLRAEEKASRYLPWYTSPATIGELLAHVGGNDWWQPFYKELLPLPSLYEKKQKLREMIRDLHPKKQLKAVYSDIDFFVLGFLMEQLKETAFENIWTHFRETCLPNNRMHFNRSNTPLYTRSSYAPTEKCEWRKKTLQGEVHDENTWALSGVSSHAGLFGRPEDVLQWGLWLRQAFHKNTPVTQERVVKKYLRRAIPERRGDWALGFMVPTAGASSCGAYFDPKSVGHTGFTGTSFWWDPRKDVMVILLSNRTYPTRKNELFRKERPKIHNMVMETLMESNS